MALPKQEQLPTDRNTDAELIDALIADPHEGQTFFAQVYGQQTENVPAETQAVELLTNNATIEKNVEASETVVPLYNSGIQDGAASAYVVWDPIDSDSDSDSESLTAAVQEWNILEQYSSKVPKNSAYFNYRGLSMFVNVTQLTSDLVIGYGKYGVVYDIMFQEPSNIRMAVKHISRYQDENALFSADIELRTLEKIGTGDCPYIVEYYGAVINSNTDQLCVGIEWMDTSIKKFYVAMHRPHNATFDIELIVRRIIHNITTALSFLETKGLVHRDVKPANMLINKNAVVKLCDFGMCGDLLDSSIVVGTGYYLPFSPEPGTIHDDMWALGISSLEVIQGQHPFADCTSGRVRLRILDWEPVIPMTVSRHIQRLILQLLRKKAVERPDSYADILGQPFIRNAYSRLSNDQHNFVCRIIEEAVMIDSHN